MGEVERLQDLPGIGPKSAVRIAYYLARRPAEDVRALAEALTDTAASLRPCSVCSHIAESDPCAICSNAERDQASILVVEAPRDVEAVERAGCYRGLYHVLMGALNPVDGTDLEHLAIPSLVERVRREEGLREIVIGTDPDAEGEATGLALLDALDRAGKGRGAEAGRKRRSSRCNAQPADRDGLYETLGEPNV